MSARPREIGSFSILDTVSTRAFSVTYLAEQRALGRRVWLKSLKSTVSSESPFAAELSREARVLGRLSHESIIRLFDFSEHKSAKWLVLEAVEGVPLSQVMAKGAIATDPAIAIALSIAEALAHAHERGVVHRGLRPEAVMLLPEGHIKLIDFSSALLLTDTEGLSARLGSLPEPLEGGESFAQPDYMAPEQILGETAGARSDVWALGVLLYAMLKGEAPFAASDRKEVAQRVRSGSPEPLLASVPRGLEQLVMRCLAKDPEDRFADGRVVASLLSDMLASRTRAPLHVLISRALSAAGLGQEIATSRRAEEVVSAAPIGPELGKVARQLAVVLALVIGGGALIELLRDRDDGAVAGAGVDPGVVAATLENRGALKVVAQPWAEVLVDGERVDVTPIGRPIWVAPGKHYVTFKHPNAPDEQRTIKIAAGQTVFLDVTMRIDRANAGVKDAGEDASDSP